MPDHKWVVCPKGQGRQHEDGIPENRIRNFKSDSVGLVKEETEDTAIVWLIGRDEIWSVPLKETRFINVNETGDKFESKICNVCHCLLPVEKFDKNQNNKHGVIRRPSCTKCRTDIDKRAPKSKQAKAMEKKRPTSGTPFKCPICRKRSIAGITAKLVADHDHHTGNIRDFICDSCNTGLGRFKNGEDFLENAIAYLKERDTLTISISTPQKSNTDKPSKK